MKKMIAIATVVLLAACGGASTETPSTIDTCKVDSCKTTIGTTTGTTTTVVDTVKSVK
jgi:hypothetical protein